jgi:hypothetical protein
MARSPRRAAAGSGEGVMVAEAPASSNAFTIAPRPKRAATLRAVSPAPSNAVSLRARAVMSRGVFRTSFQIAKGEQVVHARA